MNTKQFDITPTKEGYFGAYGGQIIPPMLKPIFDEIAEFYEKIKDTAEFKEELNYYRKHYIGRPSPIFHAKNLSEKIAESSASQKSAEQGHVHQQSRAHQGHPKPPIAQIYLKREDLNHTGAHKINHTIAEALIAKKMGKKKLIAETGAGQHGVALATAAALVQIPCEIHMGEIDIAKQAPNVTRMKMLGAKVVPVTTGTKSLKDAVDSAFNEFIKDPQNIFFGIGSVVGPHPFPMMVRDFQRVVGEEARVQFQELTGRKPDHLVACVGGGSNAIGLFSAFLEEKQIQIHGIEPSGKNQAPKFTPGDHAATITLGTPGNLHGMHTYLLQDQTGNPLPVYSIASGLDYPGVGPQHSYLKDTKRVNYVTISDQECLNAFMELSRLEGIIPALESAHAVAYAIKLAAELNRGINETAPQSHQDPTILVNLSGRGDKDVDYVANLLGII